MVLGIDSFLKPKLKKAINTVSIITIIIDKTFFIVSPIPLLNNPQTYLYLV